MQTQPLDAVGTTAYPGSDSVLPNKPMVLELVQGRKEHLYWENVPEKVRKHAVQRALNLRVGGNLNLKPASHGGQPPK